MSYVWELLLLEERIMSYAWLRCIYMPSTYAKIETFLHKIKEEVSWPGVKFVGLKTDLRSCTATSEYQNVRNLRFFQSNMQMSHVVVAKIGHRHPNEEHMLIMGESVNPLLIP